jgi:hypothetical protein
MLAQPQPFSAAAMQQQRRSKKQQQQQQQRTQPQAQSQPQHATGGACPNLFWRSYHNDALRLEERHIALPQEVTLGGEGSLRCGEQRDCLYLCVPSRGMACAPLL